jgi:hypothetical protein
METLPWICSLIGSLALAGCTGLGNEWVPPEGADEVSDGPAPAGDPGVEIRGGTPSGPPAAVAPGTVEWAHGFASWGDDVGYGVAIGADGAAVLTGTFWPEVDFGGGIRRSSGGYAVAHASYGRDGAHLASTLYDGPGNHFGYAIATAPNGAQLITGAYSGHLALPSGTLDTVGETDAFVALIDVAGGGWEAGGGWGVTFGGSVARGTGIARGADGTVYVTGTFSGTATIGATSLRSAGGTDMFVAAFDAGGAPLWALKYGSAGNDEATSIAVYDNAAAGTGYVAVTGQMAAQLGFGSPGGGPNGYVAMVRRDGGRMWTRNFAAGGSSRAAAVSFDAGGRALVAGWLEGTENLGGGAVTADSADAFVVSYDSDGAVVWMRALGGAGDDGINALRVNAAGDIAVTGWFEGEVDLGSDGPVLLDSFGQRDIFVAKLAADGATRWARSFGGGSNDSGVGIAMRADGSVVATGYYEGNAMFDELQMPSGLNRDIFLVSLR